MRKPAPLLDSACLYMPKKKTLIGTNSIKRHSAVSFLNDRTHGSTTGLSIIKIRK